MFTNFDPIHLIMVLSALLLGITVHEFAHAYTADRLGDDTPRLQGRVTLWPLAHLDPVGTLLMVISTISGFGIGWGKPVQTNPARYRRSIPMRTGHSIVVVAGPISNLIIALFFGTLLRFHAFDNNEAFFAWAAIMVEINCALFAFNLLPVYPLDGSHLLNNALPDTIAEKYGAVMRQFSLFIFIALIFTGLASRILSPIIGFMFGILTGLEF